MEDSNKCYACNVMWRVFTGLALAAVASPVLLSVLALLLFRR
jgi:hypothetical protein